MGRLSGGRVAPAPFSSSSPWSVTNSGMRGAAGAGGAAAGEFQNWKETTEAAVRMERRLDSLTGEIDSHGRPVGLGGARAELTKGLEMIERVRKRQAAVFRRLKPYKLTHPLKFMSLGSKVFS